MKEFNSGSLVIIDPEKFIKKEDLGSKLNLETGRISPNLGFKRFFLVKLGYPQYYVEAYKVESVKDYYAEGNETWVKKKLESAFASAQNPSIKCGQVSIDSGLIGVFFLSDIESYNPGILKSLKKSEYMIVENYRGKIGYTRDQYGIVHFFGTGNNNFYTL